jgi:hypothetical protein
VFDPLILSTLSVDAAETLIDKLTYFGFPEFVDSAFMARLKAELPQLKLHVGMSFDWDAVDGAEEYNAALARKNDARKQNDVSREPTISSWKDDPSERARRIWIWWRSRLQAKSILPSFRKAARLVVLVPPSSAAAERAFSQLKLILEAIGSQPLEDNVETRMLIRCNKKNYQ